MVASFAIVGNATHGPGSSMREMKKAIEQICPLKT
jgi:hypothetical protein